jgi:hypothetical protein
MRPLFPKRLALLEPFEELLQALTTIEFHANAFFFRPSSDDRP